MAKQNPERQRVAWELVRSGTIRANPETGEVFSFAKGRLDGRKLKGSPDRYGHLYTTVHWEGRQWSGIALHRLVWMAHWGQPIPDGLEIDHINRDPKDNRVANLRLATASMQQRNTEKRMVGDLNFNAHLTWEEVRQIRDLRAWGMAPRHIAEAYGTSPAYIGRIVRGDVWNPATTTS